MSSELVRRIAKRYVKAVGAAPHIIQAINGSLSAVTVWKDDLAFMASTLEALIAAGEARRLGRISDIKVSLSKYDGNRITATMQGVTDSYTTWITLKPKRGHHCNCPDWQERGMSVGPCKHVLALGKFWLVVKVAPAMDSLSEKLMSILEKSDL